MHLQCPPLDRREQAFAAANHDIILRFLRINRLCRDEWYDVVVPRYLHAVYNWFAKPEQHCYAFETLAFSAMRSAVHHVRKKERRRIQPSVSLDAQIGEGGGLWGEAVTTGNLDFINYVREERP